MVWNKPIIPVNHLLAHFYANWIETEIFRENKSIRGPINPKFPCLGLLVSGGHTDLVIFKDHNRYERLGGTRDDAAGECFDKCARLLNLPYPGGPNLSKLALSGNPKRFNLPRPMIYSNDFDFSFSGLKTAVSNLVSSQKLNQKDPKLLADLAASVEESICEVLVKKTVKAVQEFNIEQVMIAGGVAANLKLRKKLTEKLSLTHANLFVPPVYLCTDNAATTATAAIFNQKSLSPLKLEADPELSL